jgi:hypothetical protein
LEGVGHFKRGLEWIANPLENKIYVRVIAEEGVIDKWATKEFALLSLQKVLHGEGTGDMWMIRAEDYVQLAMMMYYR